MYFRYKFEVSGLFFGRLDVSPAVFNYAGPHQVRVALRRPTTEEKKDNHSEVVGESTSAFEPNQKLRKMFAELTDSLLPDGSKWTEGRKFKDADGTTYSGSAVPAGLMPLPFRDFSRDIHGELRQYAADTIRVLRWTQNLQGPLNPIDGKESAWSLDGEHWFPWPGSINATIGAFYGLLINTDVVDKIVKQITDGRLEPLGHELHREASNQGGTNPRSALVIAVSAAEVGVKNFIASRFPETTWFLENMPSPSIQKIFREYFPKLSICIPDCVLQSHKKANDVRNTMVHSGKFSLSSESLNEILDAIKDLLWILDYHSGHEWALNYLSEKSRIELGIGTEEGA